MAKFAFNQLSKYLAVIIASSASLADWMLGRWLLLVVDCTSKWLIRTTAILYDRCAHR